MALFCLYAFTLWTSMTLLSKLPEYYKCTQDTSLLAFMQSSFQSHLFTSSPFCVNLLLNSPFRKRCPTYIQMCVQLSIQKALPHLHTHVCPTLHSESTAPLTYKCVSNSPFRKHCPTHIEMCVHSHPKSLSDSCPYLTWHTLLSSSYWLPVWAVTVTSAAQPLYLKHSAFRNQTH